jgi:hypothetical protein
MKKPDGRETKKLTVKRDIKEREPFGEYHG